MGCQHEFSTVSWRRALEVFLVAATDDEHEERALPATGAHRGQLVHVPDQLQVRARPQLQQPADGRRVMPGQSGRPIGGQAVDVTARIEHGRIVNGLIGEYRRSA